MNTCWLCVKLWFLERRMALLEAHLRGHRGSFSDPRMQPARRRLRQLAWKAHLLRAQL